MNSKSLIVIIYFLIIFDPQIYGFMYLLYWCKEGIYSYRYLCLRFYRYFKLFSNIWKLLRFSNETTLYCVTSKTKVFSLLVKNSADPLSPYLRKKMCTFISFWNFLSWTTWFYNLKYILIIKALCTIWGFHKCLNDLKKVQRKLQVWVLNTSWVELSAD